MEHGFKEISPEEIGGNPFELIGNDWMLITAGTMSDWNTMTASWGGFGVLWNRRVTFCFVRPNRYTFAFINRYPTYTLSFFPDEWKAALQYCGSHSGRDVDKAEQTGLTPIAVDDGVAFTQARLTISCRTIYRQDLVSDGCLDAAIPDMYGGDDFHRFYIGEVDRCLLKPE